MSEQKLREALRDADVVLQMADRSDAWKQERDRCRRRIADALSQPTSDEGTPVKRWRVTGGLMRWVGKEKEHAAIHTPWHDDPDWQSDVVFARDYDAIERTLHAKERELAAVTKDRDDFLEVLALCGGKADLAKRVQELERQLAALQSGAAVIDQMVDRFLSWPLPKDFMPDGGISFKPIPNHQPIGTNLLTAEQARKMIEHMQGDR